MKRILFATLLGAALTNAVHAESDFLPAEPLRAAGLVKYWQLQIPLEPGQRLRDCYLVDDHLYLGTQSGYVYCLHAPTGVIRWLRPITRSGYNVRRPAHSGDDVVFVTPTDIQVYNRHSGAPVRRTELRFPSSSAPVSDGARLFVGGVDRRLYAFDLGTLFYDWRALTSAPISAAPVVVGDLIVTASDVGDVYAARRENKRIVWQTSTHGGVSADLVADDRGVYVASRDFSLYLLDAGFGNVRWRARLSGPLSEPPVPTPDLIYQYCPADGLVAIEGEPVAIIDERIRWKLPSGRLALTVLDRVVYVLLLEDTLAAVDVQTGAVRHAVPAGGLRIGLPAPGAGTVYLVSEDGRVFCARPAGVPPLGREDVVAALRMSADGATQAPATQPSVAAPAAMAEDPLQTRRGGAPIGGRSRVSREFQPKP